MVVLMTSESIGFEVAEFGVIYCSCHCYWSWWQLLKVCLWGHSTSVQTSEATISKKLSMTLPFQHYSLLQQFGKQKYTLAPSFWHQARFSFIWVFFHFAQQQSSDDWKIDILMIMPFSHATVIYWDQPPNDGMTMTLHWCSEQGDNDDDDKK